MTTMWSSFWRPASGEASRGRPGRQPPAPSSVVNTHIARHDRTTDLATMPTDIPFRMLGSTGERVSAIGLGGWHLGLKKVDEKLAIRIIRTAVDEGINFLDNSWDYNNGSSERRMGKALRAGYRDKVFLMTKIDGRSRTAATRQLNESLRRLQTDMIDLVQHHEIIRFDDPHRIFQPEGAQRALEDAPTP